MNSVDKPEHSPVGGSQLYRVTNCAGSVNLIKKHKLKSESSQYAKEGNDAHTLDERCLNDGTDAAQYIGETLPLGNKVTEDMAGAVQVYLDYVRGQVGKGDKMLVEVRFHVKEIHDMAYGSADCVIYKHKTKELEIIDYKHGAGVSVSVTDNLQTIFYGIGALIKLKLPVDTIKTTIVQPRCYHADGPIRSQTYEFIDLISHMVEIKAAIEKALDPECNEYNIGGWCHWCPAIALCPAQTRQALEMAKQDFDILTTYDLDELEAIAKIIPNVEIFCKKVREFMYNEANRGVQFQHFKLVDKQARRKWKEDTNESALLKTFDYFKLDDITKRELISPAQVEEKIKVVFPGRKKVDKPKRQEQLEKLAGLYDKKSSGTALVPIEDKRESVATGPASDFESL